MATEAPLGHTGTDGGTGFWLPNRLGGAVPGRLCPAGRSAPPTWRPRRPMSRHDVTINRSVALAGNDGLYAHFRARSVSARFEGGY
jgi:hypothetical protein